MTIEVVATRVGFYGKTRQPGDKFSIDNKKQFSERWMLKKGTAAYDAFVNSGAEKPQRDTLTGERVSSGGMAEQLAIEVEKNAKLEQQVAELEAELDILRKDAASGQKAAVKPATPAKAEEGSEDGEAGDETAAKPRRRRRTAKED